MDDIEGCTPFSPVLTNNNNIPSGSILNTTWVWGDGNTTTGSSPIHTYVSEGNYTIRVFLESDQGCRDSADLSPSVIVHSTPTADFTYAPDEPSVLKPDVTLTDASSAGIVDWEWITSDGGNYFGSSAVHEFPDSGIYEIQLLVEDGNGCRDSIIKSVYVSADLFIHIPTAFTPNGDPYNNTFGLSGLTQGVVKMTMSIYNRWGEQVFYATDPTDRWDGTYKGEPVMTGVYIYRIEFTNPKQTQWFYYNGIIELIR